VGTLDRPIYIPDDNGKVWLCPKCKKPEIGTDWISCDKCGEWYHLTINCVGIDVAPPDNVKWFCPVCKNKEKGKKSSKKEKSGSKAVAKSGSSKKTLDNSSLPKKRKK